MEQEIFSKIEFIFQKIQASDFVYNSLQLHHSDIYFSFALCCLVYRLGAFLKKGYIFSDFKKDLSHALFHAFCFLSNFRYTPWIRMLKRSSTMEDFVVSKDTCQEIRTICTKRMHQTDPENVEKSNTLNFLSFLMPFLYNFRKILWTRSSQTFKIEKTS